MFVKASSTQPLIGCVEDAVDLSLDDIRSIYITKQSDLNNETIGVELIGEDIKYFLNEFNKITFVEFDDSENSVSIWFGMKSIDDPQIKYHPERGFYTDGGTICDRIVPSDKVIKIIEQMEYEWIVNNAGTGPMIPGCSIDIELPSENVSNGVIKTFIENEEVCVVVNDELVAFDNKPFIDENGRTQVPVRTICEFLNAGVYWYENPQRVLITYAASDNNNLTGGGGGHPAISFVIGESKYSVNGREFYMDTAAKIINNRTYIPLRAVGEFLKYEVIWEE